MRHLLTACAVSLVALSSTPAALAQESGGSSGEAQADFDAGSVLVRVNGTEITLGHVIVMLSKLPQNYQSLPDEVLFNGIIQQLTDQILLSERAVEDNNGVPLEVRLAVDNERSALLAASVVNSVAAQPVAEADVAAAYDEKYANLPAEREFNASHILVAREDEAKTIVQELRDGADFAELAKKKSTGPSGQGGGALGWFGPGQMVPEFEAAVMSLDDGEVSEPVKTQFGWHVVKLNESRIKPKPTLEDTRDQITTEIQQRAVDALVKKLRDAAEIEKPRTDIPASAMRDRSLLAAN
ncbi:MAG: peptidylprolyl isomerase [Paracoccaceae bacterium]